MKYVYILKSVTDREHFYTGITDDLDARISKHNLGEVAHTSKMDRGASRRISRSPVRIALSRLRSI
jgi:predicted GIY-YIG superfamily endonuclease